jgi:1-acyl-sn-glycerol-3-phosphate acyltransferase
LLKFFNYLFSEPDTFMVYGLKLLVIGVVTMPAALLMTILGLFDPYGKHVYGISRFWTWVILKVGGVTVRAQGLNRIDPKRQYVFMVNHQSNIDIPVLMHSLPAFQLRWLAKKELLRVPLFGSALWAGKHIIVNRSDRLNALDSFKKAKQRMKGGISLVVFPEGTRSSDEKLLPFKRGGFLLAIKTQTSIVPVAINGSGRVLPKGDWRIRRGTIDVTIGEPLSVENYPPATLRALSAQVQELIGKNLRTSPELAEARSDDDQPTSTVSACRKERST